MSVPVCAIDPGRGGGIAFYRDEQTVMAVNMPETSKELWDYFNYLRETYGPYLAFIERVNVWRGDDDTPGKKFGIEKMLANYSSLVSILEANDIPVVEVVALSWQKELGLYFPKEEKQARKNRYKRFAAARYPSIKPTLRTADALCILAFARVKIQKQAEWVKARIKNKSTASLFK